ncbi:MAG TPA: Rieske 2Fe-2S domain-containing protein [Acidimicrobiales bacterium]
MPTTPIPRVRRARGAERRLPFGAPVRAWSLAEWALLPLRIFLGVTFLFAGLQKLANPNFVRPQSPISIQAQLIAASHTSPLKPLLVHLIGYAKPIGLVIAFAEVAIGLGVLLGLWTRIAAIGGAILSFSLFLTISFHASPYFTGADIVFFFAWLPFIITGGGTKLSVDAWIANRVAKKEGVDPPELVAIPFATVQRICGNYHEGACDARAGLACDQAVCPVLLGDRAPFVTRVSIDSVDRRSLVVGGVVAASVGAAALIFGGAVAETGKMIGGVKTAKSDTTQLTLPRSDSTTTTQPSTGSTTPAPSGTLLGSAKDVPQGQAAAFTIPSSGDPGIVIHADGAFFAYDAVCPHAGCTVGYYAANDIIVCPCHGSEFAVTTGDVMNGPAPHGLAKLKIVEGSNGNLYLQ